MTDQEQETEITLGVGRLLGLFFGLVILCAAFFVVGYRFGKTSLPSATTLIDANPGDSSPAVKPGASQGAIVIKSDCASKPEGCPGTGSADVTPPSTSAVSTSANASGSNTRTGTSSTTLTMEGLSPEIAKAPIASGYIVQVAAVSKQQDAEALVDALRKKQYEVFVAAPGADALFHVQIGPFADMKDAEAVRSRLINDGYNPIVKR